MSFSIVFRRYVRIPEDNEEWWKAEKLKDHSQTNGGRLSPYVNAEWACSPGNHYWNYYPGALPLN